MFVKKFEADTLDEALKAVKLELGPDAIILKTVTNKGLKGAFKSKKIEITAAISQKNYTKKAQVDKVLNDDQKRQLYQGSAKDASQTIDVYSGNKVERKQIQVPSAPGYGQLGLNKMVATVAENANELRDLPSKAKQKLKFSLDDFLGEEETQVDDSFTEALSNPRIKTAKKAQPEVRTEKIDYRLETKDQEINSVDPTLVRAQKEFIDELRQEMKTQQNKISILESQLFEMSKKSNGFGKNENEPNGLYTLRTNLKSLDISDQNVIEMIKKATYDLSKQQLENPEVVFDYALQKMTESIRIDSPLFSKKGDGEPVISIFVSEAAAGQTSMCMKIAILKKDVVIIEYSTLDEENPNADFAAQVFDIKRVRVKSPQEMVAQVRKAVEANLSVVLDLRLQSKNSDETKRFIDALKRGFESVEVLLTVSAIHSENYNRKIIARYKDLADGLIISHMDLCVSFGSIYNLHKAYNEIPLKFFGTGPVVPDDIEGASAERIMAGLFHLEEV